MDTNTLMEKCDNCGRYMVINIGVEIDDVLGGSPVLWICENCEKMNRFMITMEEKR